MPLASGKDSGSRSAWQAIGRPMAAYCAASYVAAIVVYVLGAAMSNGSINWTQFPTHTLTVAAIIAVVVAFPTFLVAGFMFMTRIPRGIGEVGVGALIGPTCLLLASGLKFSALDLSLLASLAIAGACAGLVYWLLVGRPKNPRAA